MTTTDTHSEGKPSRVAKFLGDVVVRILSGSSSTENEPDTGIAARLRGYADGIVGGVLEQEQVQVASVEAIKRAGTEAITEAIPNAFTGAEKLVPSDFSTSYKYIRKALVPQEGETYRQKFFNPFKAGLLSMGASVFAIVATPMAEKFAGLRKDKLKPHRKSVQNALAAYLASIFQNRTTSTAVPTVA